ncbi:MAG: ferritin family protein [Armatimonadota bacterium]
MSEGSEEYVEFLQLALKTEHDGYRFYVDAAGKSGSALAKATFEGLAAAEMMHIEVIQMYHDAFRAEGGVPEAGSLPERPDLPKRIATIFSYAAKTLDATVAEAADDTSAYQKALEFERKAYEMYRDMGAKTEDESAKAFCEFMATEEDDHYKLLDETLQYLNEPADWFAKYERPFYTAG